MRQCMDADNLHRRLKKLLGRCRPLIEWSTRTSLRGYSFANQRSKISAAQGWPSRFGGAYPALCRDGIEHGDADKTIENFTKAVERFPTYDFATICSKTRCFYSAF